MSRAQRRASQGSARSRRTPAEPTGGGGGSSFPMAPIAVVLGVAVVVGLIAYLIWQQSKPASTAQAAAVAAEADASPSLPGEFVNLPEIYDGPYPDHSPHVTRDVDFVADGNTNPPAGGPMWGSSGCTDSADTSPDFCGPAPWGFFTTPWSAETVNHNLEHSGVAAWYNTSDQEIIDDLREFALDNRRGFLVVSPFPDMEEETVVIVSWSRRLVMPVSEYDRDQLQEFFDVHECRFNPEGIC